MKALNEHPTLKGVFEREDAALICQNHIERLM